MWRKLMFHVPKLIKVLKGLPVIRFVINKKSSEQVSQVDVRNREKVSFVGMKPLQVDEIFQPRKFAFPSCNFGEEVRHFKGTGFENKNWNSWLHYDITSDSAFCYTCIKAIEKNMISSKNSEKVFISDRYRNWKDAATKKRGFDKHISSGNVFFDSSNG